MVRLFPFHGSLAFSDTPLSGPEGDSEAAISIASNDTLAITGLQWLFDPNFFGTHLWTGPFGSTPTFRGLLDADLQKTGKQVFGSGDADVDIGSTGMLHATTLIFLVNPVFNNAQLGVSAIACPNATSSSFGLTSCTKRQDVYSEPYSGYQDRIRAAISLVTISKHMNPGRNQVKRSTTARPPLSFLSVLDIILSTR